MKAKDIILVDETDLVIDQMVSIMRKQAKLVVEARPKALDKYDPRQKDSRDKKSLRNIDNQSTAKALLVALLQEHISLIQEDSQDFQDKVNNFRLFI